MSNPFKRHLHDLGVHSLPPSRPGDPRVRLAEEDSLQAIISAHLSIQSRATGWESLRLSLAVRSLQIIGKYHSKIYPSAIEFDHAITLPNLPNATAILRNVQRVYLVIFGAMVGGDQDPALGSVSFQYLDRPTNTLIPVQKENAKRDRAFWGLVLSNEVLSTESFYSQMTQETTPLGVEPRPSGNRLLEIQSVEPTGFAVGEMRFYACDSNLIESSYPLLEDFVEVVEIGRILRIQNLIERGYTWGLGGEEALSSAYHLQQVAQVESQNIFTQEGIAKRLDELFAGMPGVAASLTKTVQNLSAGQVGGNPGRTGESAASPNGSVCLANDDRVSFTNQSILQNLGVQVVVAANDGAGNAVVSAQLNTNSPTGSYFSERPTDHRIYRADGTEQSSLGRFINLGGSGTLTWMGSSNAAIRPGQTVYFVPAIRYPAGSGFDVPFRTVEQVWRNGVALDPANVRSGESEDLDAYATPAANDAFIAVVGSERSALHYLYKQVSVTADVNGVAVIPAGERGCFAFIESVNGRIDTPTRTGLTPNQTYRALVYYPPRSLESWQFQLGYCPYQGTQESSWLDGAVIISLPSVYINTQGGGNSVFTASPPYRYSPISMHLPSVDGQATTSYELDTSMRLFAEPRWPAVPIRQVMPMSATGVAIPSVGTQLRLSTYTGLGQSRSINGRLTTQNNQPIGVLAPLLHGRLPYQIILAFLARKEQDVRLIVATAITAGNAVVALDTGLQTAFDTFQI